MGTLMRLFVGILNLSEWNARDTESLIVVLGYIVGFSVIGIRWFKWEVR